MVLTLLAGKVSRGPYSKILRVSNLHKNHKFRSKLESSGYDKHTSFDKQTRILTTLQIRNVFTVHNGGVASSSPT